jgi:hypothetical protein
MSPSVVWVSLQARRFPFSAAGSSRRAGTTDVVPGFKELGCGRSMLGARARLSLPGRVNGWQRHQRHPACSVPRPLR